MNKKDLKLTAAEIIKESNYSISAKKQLFNFILNEADESQLKSLILDGKIEKLAEDAEEIVDNRFKLFMDNLISENVDDTEEFLMIGRETICNFVESQIKNKEELKKAQVFIEREATDYQILSMLVEGKLPDEEFNSEKNQILVERLNTFAGMNILLEQGMSSKIKDFYAKGLGTILSQIKGKKEYIERHKDDPLTSSSRVYAEKLKDQIKNLEAKREKFSQKLASIQGVKQVAGAGAGAGGGISTAIAKKRGEVAPTAQPVTAEGVLARGIEKGKELAGKAAEKGKELAGKAAAFAKTPTGQMVGGLAAAALVAYAAYKIYKNFFSKAAQACKGAADKGLCMKEYRNKAIQAQINALRNGMSRCAKSQDPTKCQASINSKIKSLEDKMK